MNSRALYKKGFALIPIRPKSKNPAIAGWTTGPRMGWSEIRSFLDSGFNVGVRTGTASKLENGYLACIDVDIKTPEAKPDALKCLRSLIGNRKFPEVRSGGKNSSRHLYFVSEEPFKMVTIAKRKDWEICVYSDGRQMVLPPSIHPSGRKYVWRTEPNGAFPRFEIPDTFLMPDKEDDSSNVGSFLASPKKEKSTLGKEFQLDETIDVRWEPGIDDATRKLIVSGVWKGKKIPDRSAYLLPAATGLVSAGLPKESILAILTDKSTVLGQCAFDHAQTKNRLRAAQWVWSYTVERVMRERNPKSAFEGVAVIYPDTLTKEEMEEQTESIDEDSPWTQYLEKTKDGKIRSTLNNCKLILTSVCKQKEVVGRDEFANQDYYLTNTPWRSKKGEQVTDIDIVRLRFYFAEKHGVEFPDNIINQALLEIADVNRYHPVREYIGGLKWDGVNRIETWLADYAGAIGPENYLRAVSRKVLVAMVKRVFEPGCKFDHVLILEGDQGVGKSTLLARLAGKWFTDQPLVIGDKDAVLTMQSKWLIELGELSSLNRSEVEQMKAFVTQRTDRIRAPYGKRVEEYPRQSIFIGSTNKEEYLKDETGNRRFWPVRCRDEQLDFDGMEAVRDQLFAEAYAYYRLGEPLYLESKELNVAAKAEQEKRAEGDEWFGAVADIVNGDMFQKNGFEMRQLASRLDQFGAHTLDKNTQMRLGKILSQLGFTRYQENIGARRKLWATKDWVNKRERSASKAAFDRDPRRTGLNQLGGSKKNTKRVVRNDFF